MCDQQSLRPACAYAQSDQSLCLSLEYSMIVKLLTERHLEFLSLKGGCTGSSESPLVKMSNCWKSRALAQMTELNMYPNWSYVRRKATNINTIPSGGISCAPFWHFVCSKNTLYMVGSYRSQTCSCKKGSDCL